RKRASAGLDFEDLIRTVRQLLTQSGASEWVLWKLDGGLRHILLDEAQDTSPEQWAIIRALTSNFFVGEGAERSHPSTLFVVGDQKQSIYSFQGADPERFLAERKDFQARASAARIEFVNPRLDMSFRSARSILGFVDETFNPEAYNGESPFSVSTDGLSDAWRHTAYRKGHEGSVEIWPLVQKDEVAETAAWDAPMGQESQSSPKQKLARAIASFIRDELEAGAGVWENDQLRPARPGDFLILVRGRKGGLFDAILQALKRAGLPVAGADRLELLDSLPVQDLLNLVRFVLCPEDDLTLAEILKGPFGGLDDETDLVPLAAQRPHGVSLWRRLRDSDVPR
ncbi:MAG: double-strand break repair helicase AddA, partial [Chitinophagia bacterium]|nr:double-strand break repair helicase AddA [Chitinophagia bacterium]